MTTPITPGDLVLRNERAEEVYLCGQYFGERDGLRYCTNDLSLKLVSTATRIGAVSEGWRIGEPKGQHAAIDLFWSNGCRNLGAPWPSTAGSSHGPHVVAHRLVQRAERLADDQDYGGFRMGVATERDPTPDLRAVAAEMRDAADTRLSGNFLPRVVAREVRAWADRIDPPKPEPPKVGDRVRIDGDSGVIRYIEGNQALVMWTGILALKLVRIADLERIP